jgi:MSHA biogenesis protein MshI
MAISLHPERIDFAHVERRPNARPVVKLLESYRREGDDADVLERLRRELSLSKYHCTTLLASGEYRIVQVDAPGVPAAEAKEALRWSIKDRLDFPVETATIDAVEVPAEGGAGRARSMFAVAAGNELIAARQQLFDAAKVPLEVIDIPELAERNIANLYAEGTRAVALLAIDTAGGLLTFTAGSELCAFRGIDITLGQLTGAGDEARYNYFERIGLEVQRSLDHFDRLFSHSPLARVLVAPTPDVPGLVEYLAQNLQVKTESLDLGAVLDFPDVPELRNPARQLQCLQVIGAALRDTGGPP